MDTTALPYEYTALAPDGSEIRELVRATGGSMVHCTLPVGATSLAVTHRTVEEVWYVVGGRGQVRSFMFRNVNRFDTPSLLDHHVHNVCYEELVLIVEFGRVAQQPKEVPRPHGIDRNIALGRCR